MVLVDERRCNVEVNGAFLQLVGYRRADLVGRPVYEIIDGGPILSASQWRETLAQPKFTGSARLICADGRRVTVEFAGHPAVIDGRPLVLAVALRTARGGRRFSEPVPTQPGPLTKREQEVVRLLALGANGPEAAEQLQLAHNTVRTHARNAMTKLGARSRAQLVAMVLAEGHAPPDLF
jgi:PAS domain S-box-containing protein